MREPQVTAEMYANWIRDTYGPDHYRKELEYIFDLLPDDSREALCDLVRADMDEVE